MGDPFIRTYIDDVLRNVRTQFLIKLIKPFTSIEIKFISKQLSIPEEDVEELLVGLILDKRISGQIDQVNSRLVLDRRSTDAHKYEALNAWSTNVSSLCKTVIGKAT